MKRDMGRWVVFSGGYTEPIQMASGEIVPGRGRGIGVCAVDAVSGRAGNWPSGRAAAAAAGLRRVFAVRVYEGCRAGRVARTVRQHRTIASSRFGGSFPSILRFETFEIHTVFLHVSNLGLTKNLSPNLLAELRGAAIKAFLAEGFSSA